MEDMKMKRHRAVPIGVTTIDQPCTNWNPALPDGRSVIAPTDSNEVLCKNDTERYPLGLRQ